MSMDWGGIIASALGGGAQAVGQVASDQIDANTKMSLADHAAQIELDRQKALEQAHIDFANQQRQAQVDRVNTAAAGIIQQGQVQRLQNYRDRTEAAMPDGPAGLPPVTADTMTDADRQMVQPTPADLDAARQQGAIQTGDISPTDAAKLSDQVRRAEIAAEWRKYGADAGVTRTDMSSGRRLEGTQYTADSAGDRQDSRNGVKAAQLAARSPTDPATGQALKATTTQFQRASVMEGKAQDAVKNAITADDKARATQALAEATQARAALGARLDQMTAKPAASPALAVSPAAAGGSAAAGLAGWRKLTGQ